MRNVKFIGVCTLACVVPFLCGIGVTMLVSPWAGNRMVYLLRSPFLRSEVVQPQFPVTVQAKQIAPELTTVKQIPVTITYKGRSTVCDGVFDTGSDFNFVPQSIMDKLNIDPADATGEVTTETINGEELDLLFEDVTFSVGEASVTGRAVIGHVRDKRNGNEYCLLGQPFIGQFKTTLHKDMITFDKL